MDQMTEISLNELEAVTGGKNEAGIYTSSTG